MKRKYKIIFMIVFLNLLSIGAGATYSYFKSGIVMESVNPSFAKFVFEASSVEDFELPVNHLSPGMEKEYLFTVKNNEDQKMSDINVEYKITIKTYHFIPLQILLYDMDDNVETLILDCNETEFNRNDKNELVCETNNMLLEYKLAEEDTYKLKISFPDQYNDLEYQDLADFIQININSWQKKED